MYYYLIILLIAFIIKKLKKLIKRSLINICMKIIGVCGKLGSGKDAFADYLVRKHGFNKITISDIIQKEMESEGYKDANRLQIQEFSKEYKEKYGNDIWAKACVEYARKNKYRRIVISGIRDSKEVDFLRKKLEKDFALVTVKAERNERFKRIRNRKSNKDVDLFGDFVRQEQREAKLFDLYENCEEIADYTIDNSKTLIELYSNAEGLLKELNWKNTN